MTLGFMNNSKRQKKTKNIFEYTGFIFLSFFVNQEIVFMKIIIRTNNVCLYIYVILKRQLLSFFLYRRLLLRIIISLLIIDNDI